MNEDLVEELRSVWTPLPTPELDGDGWYGILENLLLKLRQFRRKLEILEIGSEGGKLKVVVAYDFDELSDEEGEYIDSLLDGARDASSTACEVCGMLGKGREWGPWVEVRCNEHARDIRKKGNIMKVLYFDLETSAMVSYHWSMWQENIGLNQVIEMSNILCYAARWGDSKKMMTDAIWDYEDYTPNSRDDYNVVFTLRELLDEADVVCGHNVDRFDLKVFNTRCLYHGMKPISPVQTIDTLKVAKNKFKFASNRLDHLGDYLQVGRKLQTGGFDLWRDAMEGCPEAQAKMMAYNIQDVELLYKVERKLAPFNDKLPALSNYVEQPVCHACGSENILRNGWHITLTGKYQRLVCKDCGHHSRLRRAEKRDNPDAILRSM